MMSLNPQRTGEPTFAPLLSFRLHRLAKRVDQQAEADHRADTGLGLLECRIVGVVGADGPISFKALCERAELEKSNASRLVARMIEQGWIERHDDPADQRSFYLLPTAAGRQLRRRIHRSAEARNERWLSVLDARQRAVFSTCLELLQRQAEAMADGGTARADALHAEAEPPAEAALTWIDRRLADRLHRLLGVALQKNPPGTAAEAG